MHEIEPRRVAKVYFKLDSAPIAKNIAAAVRQDRTLCHLIDERNFRGPEDIETAHTILIQHSAKNRKLITACYKQFGGPDIEIVYFTDEGKLGATDESSRDTKQSVSESSEENAPRGHFAEAGPAGSSDIEDGNTEGNEAPADNKRVFM
jgi:hypothetical protein